MSAPLAPSDPAAPSTLGSDTKVMTLVGTAHSVSHFFHLILAPLFPWLKDEFGVSYAELGLLMTVFFVVSGVGQALSGFVVDRVGARAVLFAGLGLLGVSALVLSQAPNYWILLLGSTIAGLGNSVFHPADFTLLNKLISKRRLGHAFSVHGITGNLGWVVAPIFLIPLTGLFGWRAALACAALIPAAVLLLLYLNRSLLDEGDIKPRSAADAAQAGAAAHSGRSNQAHRDEDHALAFMRLPGVWMCILFFFIIAMALGGIQNFAVPALREMYGVTLAAATAGYTGFMLASAAGMALGGFVAARTDRHERTIAVAFAFSGVFALLIASGLLPGLLAVTLMAAVGFGSGLAGPSRDLMIRAAAPANATGRVYGVVYSGLDVGLAGAPLLFGALMDAGQPAWLFICVGILNCLAVAAAVGVGTNTVRTTARTQVTG